jgi:uncharacterized protein with GYD domain
MATYVVLANFTDQGVRNAKESLKRAEAFGEEMRSDREGPLEDPGPV